MKSQNPDYEQAIGSFILTSQVWLVPSLLAVYLGFVLWAGPRLMAGRPAFQLSRLLILFNTCQVIINGCFVLWCITHSEGMKYLRNHFCHPLPPEENPIKQEFINASIAFLTSKFVDLLDTVFLVLRKKNTHVTFLHVYHHTAMAFCVWLTVKYFPAEISIIMGTMNAFVHVVMYSYYILAGLGPQYQRYLWWKKYLTTFQMMQFAVDILLILYLVLNNCPVSKPNTIIWGVNVFIIFAFFIKFYIETYTSKTYRQDKRI